MTTEQLKNIIIEHNGHIGNIKINRPAQLNALNMETLVELERAIGELDRSADIRAIIITGEGDKAFISGADIAAMSQMNAAEAAAFVEQGHRTMNALESCSKPIIAAVNGYCFGGGLEFALACDVIYAAESALLGLPEVTLGLFPGWGGTQRLTHLIGRARAKEIILTGRRYSADEAWKLGIVNRVCTKEGLLREAHETAALIAQNGPVAVSLAKGLINIADGTDLASGLAEERKAFPRCFETEDLREGFTAFGEKRKPVFKGK